MRWPQAPVMSAERQATIAMGTATIAWSDVPPGIFDAAEHNLDWAVVSDGATVTIRLRQRYAARVRRSTFQSRCIAAFFRQSVCWMPRGRDAAVLDTNGQPAGEMQAWNADWSVAEVSVGAGRAADSSESRDRVRRFARGPAGRAARRRVSRRAVGRRIGLLMAALDMLTR
ncbi:hypothetical protein I541_5592 [Mycobacteroides abscessus]|nr:hypothetical protein I541_5592 [Mycobacteroides abscessus]